MPKEPNCFVQHARCKNGHSYAEHGVMQMGQWRCRLCMKKINEEIAKRREFEGKGKHTGRLRKDGPK